jgi:hypothetical protein
VSTPTPKKSTGKFRVFWYHRRSGMRITSRRFISCKGLLKKLKLQKQK